MTVSHRSEHCTIRVASALDVFGHVLLYAAVIVLWMISCLLVLEE